MNTEIIIYSQQLIKNPKFALRVDYGWSFDLDQWTINEASVTHISGSGNVNAIYQENLLMPGVEYKLKLTTFGITSGNITFRSSGMGGTVEATVSTNGAHEFIITPNGNGVYFVPSSNFNGSICNTSITKYPDQFTIDLSEEVSIPLTFSIDDIQSPQLRKTTYSKSISIPGTKNNNKAFQSLFEISSESLFNLNKQCDCKLLNSGILVFEGSLCFNNINRNKIGLDGYYNITYDVSLVGNLVNIFSIWGDTLVSELDFSEYNHVYNKDNVTGSWEGNIILNGSSQSNITETYNSPSISSISSININGDDHVKIELSSTHPFNIGDEVVGYTDNNYLSGNQTVIDIGSDYIVINLYWAVLTSSSANGYFSNFQFEGFGYIYPMIDMGTINKKSKDDIYIPSNGAILELGVSYIITTYFSGDDFTMSGASSNAVGVMFTYNGVLPTWSNGSILSSDNISFWRVDDFWPALFIKEIIDKSFAIAQYNYNCDLFNSNLFKRLILPFSVGNLNLNNDQLSALYFKASMTDTITDPSGHTYENSYLIRPFPNGHPLIDTTGPGTGPAYFYFPIGQLYDGVPPGDTNLVASHHPILFTQDSLGAGGFPNVVPGFSGDGSGTLITSFPNAAQPFLSDIVPFNHNQPPIDYDYGNLWDNTIYEYTHPLGYITLEYNFTFSGTCWNYVKDFYAFNGTDGDLPSDYAGSSAPGIYSVGNGSYIGESFSDPLFVNRYPQYEGKPGQTFSPANSIVFESSIDGGATWSTEINIGNDVRWENTYVNGSLIKTMNPGDKLRIKYVASTSMVLMKNETGGHCSPCIGSTSAGAGDTYFGSPVKVTVRIENASITNNLTNELVREGINFNINDILPNVKISDLFLSIINAFNLLVDDKGVDRLINISPRDSYYNKPGDARNLNWTNKINLDSLISYSPVGNSNSKSYSFKYKDGTDFYNLDYKADWSGPENRIYGDEIINVDNDFATSDNLTTLIFEPTVIVGPTVNYNSSDRVISAIYTKGNDGVVSRINSLKLLLYNIRGTNIDWSLISNYDTIISSVKFFNTFKFYPQAIHLDNHLAPNFDLNFGVPLATYYNANFYTDRNLYKNFHENFIRLITDRNSKLISIELKLSIIDIANINFMNLVYIDGNLCYLNKITDWDINSNGLCKVEFLLLNS